MRPKAVLLPLSGWALLMLRIGLCTATDFVHPGEHHPQGDRQGVIVRADNMAAQTTNNVPQQAVALDRLGPRLDDPVAVQRGKNLVVAARLELGVDVGRRHAELLCRPLALAGELHPWPQLGERLDQLVLILLGLILVTLRVGAGNFGRSRLLAAASVARLR